MTAWKNLERYVAGMFNGTRIPRGSDFSKSLPDVVVDAGYVCSAFVNSKTAVLFECKYRSKQPFIDLYEKSDLDYFVLGSYLFFGLQHSNNAISYGMRGECPKLKINKKIPKYIDDYMEQAREYACDTDKRRKIREVVRHINDLPDYPDFQKFIPIVVLGKKRATTRLGVIHTEYLQQ